MTYKQLSDEFEYWDAGEKAIKTALDKKGFNSCWAMRKLPISAKNRKFRLKFTQEHKGWTYHN
jgi:hypothetical protein